MACFTATEAGRESVTVRLADSTSCGEIGPANVLGELQEPKQDTESLLRDRGVHSPLRQRLAGGREWTAQACSISVKATAGRELSGLRSQV